MKKMETGANFARFALGDLAVIALRDGYVDMPASRLRQPGNEPFGAALPSEVELVDGKLRLSVNAFLVVDGNRHILIDTGAANAWLPTMGSLLHALDEAGIARDRIETVAFTHTHSDHVQGLIAPDGSDAFPALKSLLVPHEEISSFDADERLARFRRKRTPFREGDKISQNVTAFAAHGHEIGHSGFRISSAGETLLIWGDVVHVPSIQFARPELTWEYDRDQDEARETRAMLLRRAAEPNVYAAGAHLDFPGIGSVSRAGDAYAFASL